MSSNYVFMKVAKHKRAGKVVKRLNLDRLCEGKRHKNYWGCSIWQWACSLISYMVPMLTEMCIALLFKCYAVLVMAAATGRHFSFGLEYGKKTNYVLELWVNTNKGVLLLFWTCILSFFLAHLRLFCLSSTIDNCTWKQQIAHLFISQLQMPPH